jgi:surface polysaccharide O-acyltransferase-like enzyme
VGIPFLERFHVPENLLGQLFQWPLFASIGVFYFLLGYYLNRWEITWKYTRIIAALVFISAVTTIFALTVKANGYWRTTISTEYDSYYAGISSPLCVLSSMSLFVFLKSLEPQLNSLREAITKIIKTLSSATLGVYLFHMLVINWCGVNLPLPGYIWSTIIVYTVTVCVVIAGKKLIRVAKFILRKKNTI